MCCSGTDVAQPVKKESTMNIVPIGGDVDFPIVTPSNNIWLLRYSLQVAPMREEGDGAHLPHFWWLITSCRSYW